MLFIIKNFKSIIKIICLKYFKTTIIKYYEK